MCVDDGDDVVEFDTYKEVDIVGKNDNRGCCVLEDKTMPPAEDFGGIVSCCHVHEASRAIVEA